MTNRKEQIKEQYQTAIKQELEQFTCIDSAEDVSHQITEKLITIKLSTRKRKPPKEKPNLSILKEILIDGVGHKKADSLLLSLASNDQLNKQSIYIPTEKRMQTLLTNN